MSDQNERRQFDGRTTVAGVIVGTILMVLVMRACDQAHEERLQRYSVCQKAGGYIADGTDLCVIGPKTEQR